MLIHLVATGIWVNALLWAASFPMAAPGEEGLPSGALEAIADTVQGYCDRDIVVGSALVVIKNRHCVWSEAYGWNDRESGTPMLPDTLCNIRSMTKMLTGAACQILIDESLVRLKDPVAQYLPGFDTARSRAITVEQLLTHRSGLPLSILTSLDEYFEAESQLSIAFDRDPDGTVTGLRFYEPGQVFRLPRMEKQPGEGPRFARAEWLRPWPDGGDGPEFRACLEGTPNYRYVIEYSGDLRVWLPLQTNVLSGSRLEMRDTEVSGAPKRVYRARVIAF